MSLPSFLLPLSDTLKPATASVPSTSNTTTNAPLPSLSSLLISQFNPMANQFGASSADAKDKVKFMLVGTHCHQFTGYSKVTHGFIRELSQLPWLQLTHFGFQKSPNVPDTYRPYPPQVKVIDAVALEKTAPVPQLQNQGGFGFTFLPEVIRKEQPHVVMIYNDMGVVTRFLEEIRKSGIPRTFKIWVYVDQVYNTQLQAFIDILNRDADRVFAFTSYWKKCIKDQGVTRPVDILGHGFDSELFRPVPKEQARKALGIPNDAFVIMSLNRNQPRKRYDLLIMAFVELIVKYPTKPIHLMCICDKGEKGGWWLFEVFMRELKLRGVPVDQFGGRLMVSSQDMQFRDEDINMFYNMADIHVSTADGEGFGLCNFENFGVGVPGVVPNIGGFKEFATAENSILVKPKYRMYMPTAFSPVGGEAEVCDPHDICLGMEEYLNDSEKRRQHGLKARETILGFTWARAVKNLVKRLEEEKEELAEDN
jgi:glycosyltransferase involved in cell wall biosynthesis